MPTLFSRILSGELPARFVFRDDRSAAFLSTHPLRPGHTLVVPVEPFEHWIDLPQDLLEHLMRTAQRVGKALAHAFPSKKVGVILSGFEVPHVHVHLVPADEAEDLHFANARMNVGEAALDWAMEKIKQSLQQQADE